MRRYGVVEVFQTLQGEGHFTGRPAVFLRLAGCNLWSGHDTSRTADAQKNAATCPKFCDTDFHVREKVPLDELVLMCLEARKPSCDFLVITGGEPLLQLDAPLLRELFQYFSMIAVETNGTQEVSKDIIEVAENNDDQLWITCSPKVGPSRLKIQQNMISEMKIVYPRYDPLVYEKWARDGCDIEPILYLQPEADIKRVGHSLINSTNMQNAAQWCIEHPHWNLSIQTHKILGLR